MKKFGKFNVIKKVLLIWVGLSLISYGVYYCKDLFKDPIRCDNQVALDIAKNLINENVINRVSNAVWIKVSSYPKVYKKYHNMSKEDTIVFENFIKKQVIVDEFNSLTPKSKKSCTGVAYYKDESYEQFYYSIEYDPKTKQVFTAVSKPSSDLLLERVDDVLAGIDMYIEQYGKKVK